MSDSSDFLGVSPAQAKVLVCVLAAVIAIVDFLLPANINIASLYFLPIVLSGWTRSSKWLWGSTAVFIFLTFGGVIVARAPIVNAITWIDWLNRTMTAVALGVTAVPVHLRVRNLVRLEKSIAERDRAERALQESHAQLEKRVEERTEALSAANRESQSEIAARIEAEAHLRNSEASLRRLSVELLRAQDDERRHIARELHDGLGQCLAGLKLGLHFVDQAIPLTNEPARRHFGECEQLTNEAVSQVRTLSHLMHPPLLEEMGLESAIPWYVRGFEQRSGIQTKLDMPESLIRLPREVELTVFRILQESLTNIHRHSGSRTAQVSLRVVNGNILLEVRDEGKGLQHAPKGVGLRGMEERTKELMGRLEVSTGPKGTTLTATLPCGTAAAATSS